MTSEKASAAPTGDAAVPKLLSRLVSVTADWIDEPLPPREHLLTDVRTGKGAVDKTGVWMFSGPGGVSKSYASMELTLVVGSGGRWLGTFDTSGKPGRAMLILAEDDAEDARRRLKYIADKKRYSAAAAERIDVLPIQDEFVSLVSMDRSGTYTEGEGLVALRELIAYQRERHGGDAYDLVVIDPCASVAGVSLDKDSAAATAFVVALNSISKAAGGLVLGIHHTNKSSREVRPGRRARATDNRGSTALTDRPRGVIQLEPVVDANLERTNRVVLSLTKENHVAPWKDVVLQRDENGVLFPLDEVDRAQFEAGRKKPDADQKQAARDARARDRMAADAKVVRQIIKEGFTGKLRDAVRARIGCGAERADFAIARVRDEDASAPGPRGASSEAPEVTQGTTVPPSQDGDSVPRRPPTPPVPRGTEAPGAVPLGAFGASKAPQGTGGTRGTNGGSAYEGA